MKLLKLLLCVPLVIVAPALAQSDFAVAVETAEVTPSELESSVRAVGTLTAEASATLRAEVPGQIIGVHFIEGQPLAKDAKLFSIEIEFRAEMSNHLHVVLRTRPEIAKRLAPREVARRWLTITKLAKCMTDDLPVPDEKRIDEMVGSKKKIAELRQRLSSISWFMGTLLENIARRANDEDGATGRFWETRFRCRECADVSGILLCAIYVDLNAMRAGEADSPETARYTSACLLAPPPLISHPHRSRVPLRGRV